MARLLSLVEDTTDLETQTTLFAAQISRAKHLVGEHGEVLSQHLSQDRTWQAYKVRKVITPRGPCPTCTVGHKNYFLHVSSAPDENINANWLREDPCQCAEAWVSSQLLDANQFGESSDEMPIDLRTGRHSDIAVKVFSLANCSITSAFESTHHRAVSFYPQLL
jgi:hypothetical protein